MSPNKRISRETGAISLDGNLFDEAMQHLSALTRNDRGTTAESFHVSDSDGDCPGMNVTTSRSASRPPNRSRPAESTNGMMSMVLHELREMKELLVQNKQQNDRIENSLNKLLRYRRPLARRGSKPAGFPLNSVDEIRRFEEVDDEEYDAVVDYCVWLAGCTPCECANAYVKNLLRDNVLQHVTWHGSHDTFALKGTRLVEAFEEAMNNNKKFGKINSADLGIAIKRALRCAKERLRKSRLSATLRNRNPRMEMEDEDDE
ncbi:hypothetical protein PV326_007281 [Microctonus aethiopoides]|nr:hypothetical protein PV326_007281 [Microctonus aethiopoides]